MAVIFLLGILATKAEPALNVLGDTVQVLSGGKFTKKALIWAVCVGVAVGMCAGERLQGSACGQRTNGGAGCRPVRGGVTRGAAGSRAAL